MNEICPCGNLDKYSFCCEPIIKDQKLAITAEKLMRSRYCAYTKSEIKYLIQSTHISQRYLYNPIDLKNWADNSKWLKLEIIKTEKGNENDSKGKVEFKAYYIESGIEKMHHEISDFKKEKGLWYFVSGVSG